MQERNLRGGGTREVSQQGADFAKDVSNKSKATAEDTTKALGETCWTLATGSVNFHREWIEMGCENTNANLDFIHRLLGVKSPSAFVELTAEHTRKQVEAFTEQARHLTAMAQKMTTDAIAPLQASVKSAFSRPA